MNSRQRWEKRWGWCSCLQVAGSCCWTCRYLPHASTVRNPGQLESLGSRKKVLKKLNELIHVSYCITLLDVSYPGKIRLKFWLFLTLNGLHFLHFYRKEKCYSAVETNYYLDVLNTEIPSYLWDYEKKSISFSIDYLLVCKKNILRLFPDSES